MYGGSGIVIMGIAVMYEHLYCIVLLIVSAVYIISVFVIAEQLDRACHHDISMFQQSVYAVSTMEETTKSLRISFHLYTATKVRHSTHFIRRLFFEYLRTS